MCYVPYTLLKYHFESYLIIYLVKHLVLLLSRCRRQVPVIPHRSLSSIQTFGQVESLQKEFLYLQPSQLLRRLYQHHLLHEGDLSHSHGALQGQTLQITLFDPSLSYDDKRHLILQQLRNLHIDELSKDDLHTLLGKGHAYWVSRLLHHLNVLNLLYLLLYRHASLRCLRSS